MINIAMLSKWHVHADDYAGQALKMNDKVKISAIWDEDADRGKQWAIELGVEFYPTYQEILALKNIDAIICNTPTTMHREILCAAAKAGKHIFTEKMLACTAEDAEAIAEEVLKSGVLFVISHPLTSNAVIRRTKKLMYSGKLGKISCVRFRRSHGGVSDNWLPERWYDVEASGGGAMMDLGAHPVYILDYLCGEPKSISSAFSNIYGTSSDESAVALLQYENGVIGLAETAFVTYGVPDILEVYGSDGYLLSHGNDLKIIAKEKDENGVTLESGEELAAELNSDQIDDPFTRFIHCLENKALAPTELNIDTALICSKVMAQIYKNAI